MFPQGLHPRPTVSSFFCFTQLHPPHRGHFLIFTHQPIWLWVQKIRYQKQKDIIEKIKTIQKCSPKGQRSPRKNVVPLELLSTWLPVTQPFRLPSLLGLAARSARAEPSSCYGPRRLCPGQCLFSRSVEKQTACGVG